MHSRDINFTCSLADQVYVHPRTCQCPKYLRRYADHIPHLVAYYTDYAHVFDDVHGPKLCQRRRGGIKGGWSWNAYCKAKHLLATAKEIDCDVVDRGDGDSAREEGLW